VVHLIAVDPRQHCRLRLSGRGEACHT
jgi:hypothetical protein